MSIFDKVLRDFFLRSVKDLAEHAPVDARAAEEVEAETLAKQTEMQEKIESYVARANGHVADGRKELAAAKPVLSKAEDAIHRVREEFSVEPFDEDSAYMQGHQVGLSNHPQVPQETREHLKDLGAMADETASRVKTEIYYHHAGEAARAQERASDTPVFYRPLNPDFSSLRDSMQASKSLEDAALKFGSRAWKIHSEIFG